MTALNKEKFTIPAALAVKVVEQLHRQQPQLVSETIACVEKPQPAFIHRYLLPLLLEKFCRLKGYETAYIKGINLGQQRKWEQTVFITIILMLYSPGVFKGIYNVEDGIRDELAAMLRCNAQGISQQVGPIVMYMQRSNYPEFSEQVNYYVTVMKQEIGGDETE